MDIPLTHLGLSLLAGSLTTLSPCVFPILPLVIGGAVQANRLAPVAMGVGMAVSFALIGILLGALGPALDIDSDSVRIFGAWLLISFGLVMLIPALNRRFTEWMLPIASSANAASARLDGSSLSGAFLLGGVLGLVWSPCSGPLLASALTLVASEGGALKGGIILGLFGVGAAIPLVAVAYASRRGFSVARDWVLQRIELIKKSFGVLIFLTGIAILSGADKWLEAKIVYLLPDAWISATTLF
ncbi:MAG: cytochrome c biogenesis protein CcdA [Aquipseudomonas alcaligenes]|uniref:Cytochrome c biogenesis protein CcdA n=1 Tax=Aquipseudomonas alcaligenes TaxID=43263 RepID=A0A5C7W0G0_AQUAC|nr:MAG: cytochrome c biogenesis protein CcdA [Pseudomonas alcaligenes]